MCLSPRLRAVNTIAKRLRRSFPDIAVDTLAYQGTVTPPTLTKPEPNVIIRLCDSGVIASKNLGAPLTDESNKAFAAAIEGWFVLTKRIYIWNYVVDFVSAITSSFSPVPWSDSRSLVITRARATCCSRCRTISLSGPTSVGSHSTVSVVCSRKAPA